MTHVSNQPTDSTDAPSSAGKTVADRRLEARLEAVLISSGRPIGAEKLASTLFGNDDDAADARAAVREAVDTLNREYDESDRAFRIAEVSGGFRVVTRPEYVDDIAGFQAQAATGRLSRAAIETLAIVAYRQPVTRAEIDAIRGVASGEVLRSLIDRGLVAITGRAEELGRPMLYGTNKRFLETFGLKSIKDLPDPDRSLGGEDE